MTTRAMPSRKIQFTKRHGNFKSESLYLSQYTEKLKMIKSLRNHQIKKIRHHQHQDGLHHQMVGLLTMHLHRDHYCQLINAEFKNHYQ